MKHLANFSVLTFISINFLLSFFLYANVLEKAFFVDLPYFASVQTVDTPINLTDSYSTSKVNRYGILGRPTNLRVPKLGINLNLDEPISEGNQWKLSSSKAYLITLDESKSGMFGDSLIFASPNFSLFGIVNTLNEGDRFSIETDKGYLYSFRVKQKMVEDAPYTVQTPDENTKVFIVESLKKSAEKGMVITAVYESVEEII